MSDKITKEEALKIVINNRVSSLEQYPLPTKSILITEENERAIRNVINCGELKVGKEYVVVFDDDACNYPYTAYQKEHIIDVFKPYILQTQQERIKELEKSDESKEQSSIRYYNEMRKYKGQLNAIREKSKGVVVVKENGTHLPLSKFLEEELDK
jgi:hypothetical protein